MDVSVVFLITVHVVSGLIFNVIGQTSTSSPLYVTGPNVCVTNITFKETRLVTYTYRSKYYTRCKWNRRCARYRIQLMSRSIAGDAWRFEPRCCEGFTQSGDRCEKVFAEKVQTLDNGSDVTDLTIWPPIIGTILALFAIATIVIIVVLKRKSSSSRNGSRAVEIRAMNNQTYGDAMPSTSHSYETLDTKSQSYETLDTSRVGMTQNIYDSIDTYKILQSGSRK